MFKHAANTLVSEAVPMKISDTRLAAVIKPTSSGLSSSSSSAHPFEPISRKSRAISDWLCISPERLTSRNEPSSDIDFNDYDLEYPDERQETVGHSEIPSSSEDSSQNILANTGSISQLSSSEITSQDSVCLSGTNLSDQIFNPLQSTPKYSPSYSTLLRSRNSHENQFSPCFRSTGSIPPLPLPVSPTYSHIFGNGESSLYSPFGRNLEFIHSADWSSFDPFVSPVIHSSQNGTDATGPDPAYQSFSTVNPAVCFQDKESPFMKKLLTAFPTTVQSPPNSPMHAIQSPHARQAQNILSYQDSSQPAPAPLLSPCKSIQFRYQPTPLQFSSVSVSTPTVINSSMQHLAALESDASGSELSSFNSRTTPARPLNALTPHTPLTPLTPLTDDEDSIPPALRAKRNLGMKRSLAAVDTPSPSAPRKRFQRLPPAAGYATPRTESSDITNRTPTTNSEPTPTNDSPEPVVYPQRTVPASVPKRLDFILFYRRFPTSTYFQPSTESSCTSLFDKSHPGGTYNPPRDAFDIYTPRFVKGKGKEKVGLCPICLESVERGGEGKKVWLSMKFSAFKCYHMQYQHGISAVTALPFSPPIAFRVTPRPHPAKKEKSEIVEGKCHKCRKWIAIEGVKDMEIKVRELFWWKHAAACHQGSMIEGETDFWVEDQVYMQLKSL